MKSIERKAAIVTGSTSGIGLGIARALAGAGCDVMLNGFGEASAIERERAKIAKDFGVRAAFNSADLAKPAEIQQMVEAATREFGKVDILVNNAGIQHTAPVEEFPGRPLGCRDCHQSLSELPRHPSRHPADASTQLGPHYQYRFDAWAGGLSGKGRLRCCQARGYRTYKSRGARNRHDRDYLQCDLPRLGLDAIS